MISDGFCKPSLDTSLELQDLPEMKGKNYKLYDIFIKNLPILKSSL
jgi:hypothetical protein